MNAPGAVLALLLDALLGEPVRWHPLVGFGRWASWWERQCNRASGPVTSFLRGTAVWFAVILPIVLPLLALYLYLPQWRWLLDALVGYLCIGMKSLKQHVRAVYQPLCNGDLNAARLAVGRIVSRQTAELDAVGVRKAAVESALENGSDAIFAPLFWLAVAGAPAVLLYRLANTLDAMWGYRNAQFLYFGRCAARVDDALNWLPARLTAVSFALLGNTAQSLRAWRQLAPACASPNAGAVMAAGAGALGLQLGGPATYHGRVEWRPQLGFGDAPENSDLLRALNLLNRTAMLWCAVLLGIYVLA